MAVSKLSQIAAAGAPPAAGTQFVAVTGGNTDNLYTITQITAGLGAFTSTLQGVAPSSGGGTTNFLRADGTWTAPPSGSIGGTIASGSDTAVLFIHPANTLAQDVGAFTWNDTSKVLALTNTSGAANSAPLSISNQTTVVPAFHIQFTDLNFSDQTISTDGLGTLILQPSTSASGAVKIWNPTTTRPRIQVGLTSDPFAKIQFGLDASDQPQFGFGPGSSTRDTFMTRPVAANFQLGLLDSATPVAQTLSVQSAIGGSTNVAGPNWTLQGALSTGVAAPGFIPIITGYNGYPAGQTLTSISNASPAVFTAPANHNLFGGVSILLSTTGTLPSPLTTLTPYYIDNASLAATTFEVSASLNGAVINTTTNGSGTHSYAVGGLVSIIFGGNFFSLVGNPGLIDGMQIQFQCTGSTTGFSTGTNYFWRSGVIATTLHGSALTGLSFTGTLTFTVVTNVQNQSANTPFIIGPGAENGFFGQGGSNFFQPAFQVNQTWNTTTTEFQQVAAFYVQLNNLRFQSQPSCVGMFQTIGGSNNPFQIQSLINNHTFSLNAGASGGNKTTPNTAGPPSISFESDNFANGWLTLEGNPIVFASGLTGTGSVAAMNEGANGVLSLYNFAAPTSATSFRIYNTTDNTTGFGGNSSGAPTNYERGIFDWTTTANTLTIGYQAGGTGSASRNIFVTTGSGTGSFTVGYTGGGSPAGMTITPGSGTATLFSGNGTLDLHASNGNVFLYNSTAGLSFPSGSPIAMFTGGGQVTTPNGWYQWAGQTRVTSDFSVTSSTTLTNVTGLTVNVQAGRTYTFEAVLLCTDAAAGGVQASISGTATITNLIYEGYTLDANTVKGQTQATAFGTAVGSTTTTGTTPSIRIQGTITVNAAGTLTVQFAQNTSNGTASVVKRGSHFLVQDMP